MGLLPAWDDLREIIPELHWGALSIDTKDNAALAKRLGVLSEGIPNIKLFNIATDGQPVPILTGTAHVYSAGSPHSWALPLPCLFL